MLYSDSCVLTFLSNLDGLKVNWIELRSENGYQRFEKALINLGIPYNRFSGDIDKKLTEIFDKIFSSNTN